MNLKTIFPMLVALAFAASVIAAGPDEKSEKVEAVPSAAAGGSSFASAPSAAAQATAETGHQPVHSVPAAAEKNVALGARSGDWDACIANNSVLEDLKKRQADLDSKEKELKTRESDIHARETAINEEMKKLDTLRKDISGLKAARRQKNEEQISKLTETIEKMSPKAGAQLLGKVDEDLAVAAMNGLSTDKLAKIMGNMEMSRSIRLSELLAMGENAPSREPSSESKTNGKKGGDDGSADRP